MIRSTSKSEIVINDCIYLKFKIMITSKYEGMIDQGVLVEPTLGVAVADSGALASTHTIGSLVFSS